MPWRRLSALRAVWAMRRRTRRTLSELDDRQRADVGLTRRQALRRCEAILAALRMCTRLFDHLAEIIDGLTRQLGLTSYVLFMQDYGGPIGFRLAMAHPQRVSAIVIQNAVAHEEGLGPLWEPRRAYWRDRVSLEGKVISSLTSLEGARERHVGSSPHPERYNPDTWTDEYAFLTRPGRRRIQADLFYDYQTNVASYPTWQAWLREHRPPMLVVWGRYDPSFTVAGATAYKRDVPDAELHILDAGHFAMDEALDQIARLVRDFLGKRL